ncbi:hypothetical protein EPVG_00053 [Emiliania huxleyi virus 201]|nr:hypothetical protein ELVG_00223 [Emiliania huxleyi virus 203]AEP15599.1 hypothetical protein EQVG_00189 [Emiliania huxleyi virus 207]AEP16015.1 hypothetical protein ERVG_00138 [Emiliania huxleyi virus 208]AET97941.1 hypothetical protein EPVG_00053 [Emiliania huxleyi virus 201]
MFGIIIATLGIFRKPPSDGKWWYDSRIHNLGNIGSFGKFHANVAGWCTDIIDKYAYNQRNIRDEILSNMPYHARVCDMGCGVGKSTTDNILSIGIDTSDEMLAVARKNNKDKLCTFAKGNAISYGEDDEFDYSTIFFLLHEAPQDGRIAIIENAMRISERGVLIVDMHPKMRTPRSMLSGEPYVLNYMKHIREDINKCCYTNDWYIHDTYTHIDNYVMVWALRPNKNINTLLTAEAIV